MTTTISKLFSFQRGLKGFGQLAAYTDVDEGVAFEMDNELIWDSSGRTCDWAIRGVSEKKETSKFCISRLSSGKVTMKDWNESYLAPIPPEEHPNTYPLRPDPNYSPKDESLHFDVFHMGNKVAFKAYNGLFLARVYRDFHTIEAAKAVDDDSCYFRPMIGDLQVPTFEIVEVFTYGLEEIDYRHSVLQTQKFDNLSDIPMPHTFTMTWETTVTDRVVWKHLWGRGLACSHEMKANGVTITLKYTEDNDGVVHVNRSIHEQHQTNVVVPPKSMCTVCLLANKCDSASFSFMAFIRKVKPNGVVLKLHQPGAWGGLLYKDVFVDIEIKRHRFPCTIM